MEVLTRAASAADAEWLFALHKATMRERVELVYGPWDEAWQRDAWADRDPRNVVEVIVADGVRVGAIHTRTSEDGSLYLDLFEVLPDYQGRGVGACVLEAVCAQAGAEQRDATLRVHKGNPAQRLYERLGFKVEGQTATHHLMRRGARP